MTTNTNPNYTANAAFWAKRKPLCAWCGKPPSFEVRAGGEWRWACGAHAALTEEAATEALCNLDGACWARRHEPVVEQEKP